MALLGAERLVWALRSGGTAEARGRRAARELAPYALSVLAVAPLLVFFETFRVAASFSGQVGLSLTGYLSNVGALTSHLLRHELLHINFSNSLRNRDPGAMTVVLPEVDSDGSFESVQPRHHTEGLEALLKRGEKGGLLELKNRQPKWNDGHGQHRRIRGQLLGTADVHLRTAGFRQRRLPVSSSSLVALQTPTDIP